ncbi:MAG: fused MFS/spermidine synthase [Anaerolineae bacterium]|nr:fused MFS/spermidine synthase [Anaerolineae bacterium]
MATALSPSPSTARHWLWRPNLIVFISNACIMVLELVAERVIAPHVGVSLYTWTSIIGVVLAGMSLGNYVGGRLADRSASARQLGLIFLLGGLTSLLTLITSRLDIVAALQWPLLLEIVLLITLLFFLPAAILGTVSPIVAKLALRDLAHTGRTVGKIYAAGTVGSILGTLATGFVLTALFGTHRIIWGVGVVLLAMGLIFLVGGSGKLGEAQEISDALTPVSGPDGTSPQQPTSLEPQELGS